MTGFFWTSGHLGWGIFAIAVFTGLWFLLADMVWRMRSIRIQRLAVEMSIGWAIGTCLIVLMFYLAGSW